MNRPSKNGMATHLLKNGIRYNSGVIKHSNNSLNMVIMFLAHFTQNIKDIIDARDKTHSR